MLLFPSPPLPTLAFLRLLQLSFSLTSSLLTSLKSQEFFSSSPTSSSLLDGQVAELFVPFLNGNETNSAYLESEEKSLGELWANELGRFEVWHKLQAARAAKSAGSGGMSGMGGMFDRMVNQMSSGTGQTTASTPTPTEESRFGGLLRITGQLAAAATSNRDKSALDATILELEESGVKEKDGELDLTVAERLLRWHGEAVGRMVELSAGMEVSQGQGEVPKMAFRLMRLLVEKVGKGYVEMALDT
jgi:exocyst complex component 5